MSIVMSADTEWPGAQFSAWTDRRNFSMVLQAHNIHSHVHIGVIFTECCLENKNEPIPRPLPQTVELCSLGRYKHDGRPACDGTEAKPEEPFLPVQVPDTLCYDCRTYDLRWMTEDYNWNAEDHRQFAVESIYRKKPDPFRRGQSRITKAQNEMVVLFEEVAKSLDAANCDSRESGRSKRKFERDARTVEVACDYEYESVSPKTESSPKEEPQKMDDAKQPRWKKKWFSLNK